MTHKAHIQIDLDAKLADDFAAAVTSAQTSQTEVLQAMVQDYVERQKVDADYRSFLEAKVSRGRSDAAAGDVVSIEDAEQIFAARRKQAIKASGA
ncbi:hypothetical protein [Rhizobium sp. RU36D]|uniref:hypothetical protein n=1 Tax=Rhizobium sp. RU36D TaxID=1907415 RepID=UPI0009D8DD3A|nr:hypothetical protein [Rhizobium sp. RU36D]SMD16636.1 hypothetical protein SAMN05880593_1309 [Rhizobium sp. RU36D]